MRDCPTDRISNLPCNVINRILERLSFRDAVRMSILSRGWRFKWVTTPCLSFDRNFKDSLKGKYNVESIIDKILVLHRGDVVKFSLVGREIKNLTAITRWLFYLSDHNIEDLEFSYSPSDIYPMMPIHLFAFDHLTHLKIKSCEVKLPPEFRGFRRLVRLDLVDVHIEPGDLQMWLSKCPMLEYLDVDDYDGFLNLDINAPNLKFFNFWGGIESICIKNSNLEDISISCGEVGVSGAGREEEHFELPDSRKSESNLFKVLGHMLCLKRLHLDCWAMPYFAKGGLPRKLPNDLNHLTVLDLSSISFGNMNDVACALCLIRSSPNLHSLILSATENDEPSALGDAACYLKEEQQKWDVPHGHLKYVGIGWMSNKEYAMEFVKLLLRFATALEKFEISSIFSDHKNKEQGFKMLQEISSFPRASSRAVVIFN